HSSVAIRIEVWYALNTTSTSIVLVELAGNHNLAIELSEWPQVVTTGALDTSNSLDAGQGTVAQSSLVSTTARDVVIGAAAFEGTGLSATINAGQGFTELLPLEMNSTHGRAAFRMVDPGGYAVEWSLSTSAAN